MELRRAPSTRRTALSLVAGLMGVAAVAMGATALISAPTPITPAAATVTAAPANARAAAATPPPLPANQFTLVAAGDVLPHAPVVASATTAAGIDFTPLTAAVRPYIDGADLAICHMEVPVAPPGVAPSGYPMFGAPSELVAGLASDGWDGCSTASNHSVDRGAAGIEATLAAFEAQGMGATGTARSEAEAATTQMYLVHGAASDITVAHISFAYDKLNGLPKPAGQPWAVNTFDEDVADATPIIEAAQRARDEGADVVIASVHCCVEYQTEPTAPQRLLAERIAASGTVDLYVGHHAHVPQPIEKLPGGPTGDGMWVAFGLGNFLSNQDSRCCAPETSAGVLLTATFTVEDDGGVLVEPEWTGITVDTRSRHTMHALNDIPDGAGTLSAAEVSARLQRVADAVGSQAPQRTAPAEHLAYGTEMVPRTSETSASEG